jgi:hypothetical protein
MRVAEGTVVLAPPQAIGNAAARPPDTRKSAIGARGRHMLRKREVYRAGKSGYVSEFTLFMDKLLEWHPEIVEDQHVGRAMLWDKQVDFDELEKARVDSVSMEEHGFLGGHPLKREIG